MKKLLSLLMVLLLCVSAMPSFGLASDTLTENNMIFTRDAIPSTATLLNRSPANQNLTVASDANGEEYYLYTLTKKAYDSYLEYLDHTVSMVYEMTFMLASATSTVKFVPVFYDPGKSSFNWSQVLTVSKTGGVVVNNITDATGENLFAKIETGWNGNNYTVIPNVTLNTKHTIRLEHNPETEKFTVWFDSYKVVLNENANGAWVEATKASSTIKDTSKGRIDGMRFAFAGEKDDAIKVYRYYIRGTKEDNTDSTVATKVFTDALDYTYANDVANNPFRYYIDAADNAVITGFKYGVAPSDDYTQAAPLVFPNTLENRPVTKIADYAFTMDADGWPVNPGNSTGSGYTVWENIKAIKLPDTLKTIGDNSMRGFKNVTAVEIPDSVESVGASAFAYLTAAEKLDLGTSLKTLGNLAFSYFGKSNFDLVVPKSVETIGTQAFTYCRINTIVFEGTPSIGTNMFRNNNWLQKVVFLKDVTLGSGFFGLTGNQNTNKNICIVGSKEMYDAACENAKAAGVENYAYTHSDIYVYKSASTPSVYYWGTDNDATLIKAQYNKSTKELASCVPVTMTAGNSYALELGNGTYDVKNLFWSMNDCKPLVTPVEY